MAIPKNVPEPGGAQRRPQGIPQSPQGGLPRIQRPGSPAQGSVNRPGLPTQNNRPPENTSRPDLSLPPIDLSNTPSQTSEYGFGETSKISRVQQDSNGRVNNPYDGEDDTTFTPLSVDEVLDYESNEDIADREVKAREEKMRVARERRIELERRELEEIRRSEAEAAKVLEEETENNPPPRRGAGETESVAPAKGNSKSKRGSKGKKDKNGQTNYIDEENLQLEPFGGKRKLKVNELDGRKNLRQRAQIIQYIVIALALVLVIFAGKNAFFPAKSLQAPDVQGIIAQTVGITDFPLEGGKGFAKDFMEAYLTVNGSASSKAVLGYYYNGVLGAADSPNRTTSQGFKQTVLFGPTVYEAEALTDYSARYTIGALVEPSPVDGAAPADGSSAKWTYFNVNVYYDKASDSFSITPDSPSVVPSVEVGDPSEVPIASPLGVGKADQEVADKLQSVVHGFIKGYAVTSPTDHSTIDQYIVSDSDENLLKGLNNTFTLAGSEADAIKYQAFATAVPGELKIAVTVNWRDQLGAVESNNRLEYKSNYVMTLQEQSNGKYLVSKFAPQYYVTDVEE